LRIDQHRYDEATKLLRRTLELTARNEKLVNEKVHALNLLGTVAEEISSPDSAIFYYEKASSLVKSLNDKFLSATIANNLAVVYKKTGSIDKALNNYMFAAKIFEEQNNRNGLARTKSNIGSIFYDNGDYKKALEYFKETMEISKTSGNKMGVAMALNNIGSIYLKQKEFAKALKTYNECLAIGRELNVPYAIATSLNNIGNCYIAMRKFSEALPYIKSSLEIKRQKGTGKEIAVSLNSVGKINAELNQHAEAIANFEEALKYNENTGHLETRSISLIGLAKSCRAVKNFERSTSALFEYITLKDSLISNEKIRSVEEIEGKYQNEKKQLQIDGLKKDEALRNKELEAKNSEVNHQTILRNVFVAGFILVLILAFMIFKSYRQKNEAHLLIRKQKMQVDEKQKEILDSIHYARKIQQALITNESYIEKNLRRLNRSKKEQSPSS
jgi:tetratricopeptide (TPR) repeat protein